MHPEWLLHQKLCEVKSNAIDDFYKAVQKNIPVRSKQLRLAYIGRIVESINQQRDQPLPQPPVISVRSRPVNRFTPATMQLSQKWLGLQRIWLQQLESRAAGHPTLLDDKSLLWIGWIALTGNIPTLWNEAETFPLMSLTLAQRNNKQYWLPAEWINLAERLGNVVPTRLDPERQWQSIRSALRTALPDLPSFKRLMIGRHTAMAFSVPPFLVDLHRGITTATDLAPQDMQRVMLGYMFPPNYDIRISIDPQLNFTEQQSINNACTTSSTLLIRELRKALNTGTSPQEFRTAIQSFATDNANALDTAMQLVIKRALHLVQHGGLLKKVLRVSTIRRYLSCFISRLIEVADGDNLLLYSAEEWQNLYETILSKAPKRGDVCQNLRDFHEWLVNQYGVDPLDFESIDGYALSEHRVHAKLISPVDLDRAIEALSSNVPSELKHLQKIAVFILQLAFYCGLRRNEVLFLRIKDVQGSNDPYLIVTHHRARRLKTNNARRKLPLKSLLPPNTLDQLLEWRDQLSRSMPPDGLLFATSRTPSWPTSQHILIPFIQQVLRLVTGDTELVFHSLRHSFANWTMIRLAAAEEQNLLDFSLPVFKHKFFQKDSLARLRSGIFPDQLPNNDWAPERRALYAIASMMGHADPGTTLQSYIHLHRWLTARHLQQDPILFNRKTAAWILGCHLSNTYKRKFEQEVGHGEKINISMSRPSRDKCIHNATRAGLVPYKNPHINWPKIEQNISPTDIVRLLPLSRKNAWSPEPFFIRGLNEESAVRWLNNAKWIENCASQKPRNDGSHLRRLPAIKLPPIVFLEIYENWTDLFRKAWQQDREQSLTISEYMFNHLIPREHTFRFQDPLLLRTVINWLTNSGISAFFMHCTIVLGTHNAHAIVDTWDSSLPEAININHITEKLASGNRAELRIEAQIPKQIAHPMSYQVFEQALAAAYVFCA